ncbi:amino acid transporter [Crepidotus variabilis]|uniref:Amino acid transporter n=1 Tax=Crepidotus variabilis TaxID=179855 RepID=A0A9P6EJ53_9AGAR|nr:amino acid transporter [Crepidotus variabilis]
MNSPESGSSSDIAKHGLKEMGYKQELTRTRGLFHILFNRTLFSAFGLAAPFATGLIGGGPATLIWGWVLTSIATQPLALSLAEICSKYPTSAGMPYWCFRLTSSKRRLLASWINGWLTMVGVWTISLSVTFGTAQILVAGINIFQQTWDAQPWQTYLVFVGVTVFSTLVGVLFNKLLPTIDIICAAWTALGVIVILVCLSVKAAAGRHPASFALGNFDPSASGWSPGWTFFIGLLPVTYTYAAIGMVASMAEEVHNPAVQLPLALAWLVPIGFVIGVIYLLPIMFTLPDITTLLNVHGGQPIGVLFELVMGSKAGGFGVWFIVFGIGIFCGISISCAASRATWSFARDSAIPLSWVFSKVIRSVDGSEVPLNAYILSLVIQLLLGLLFLGSSVAFNAFVGVASTCLGASYIMPIALSLIDRRETIRDAPFSLGDRLGWFLNVWAVLWTMLEIVLYCMPAVIPVTKNTMNYASVVFVGFGLISAIWYLINGRKNYKGPPNFKEDQNKNAQQELANKSEQE